MHLSPKILTGQCWRQEELKFSEQILIEDKVLFLAFFVDKKIL